MPSAGEAPRQAQLSYQAVTAVWTVAFATGTELANAREYEVDMMTGEVTEVQEE